MNVSWLTDTDATLPMNIDVHLIVVVCWDKPVNVTECTVLIIILPLVLCSPGRKMRVILPVFHWVRLA